VIGPGHLWCDISLTPSQVTCTRFYNYDSLASTGYVRWATRGIDAVDAELQSDVCFSTLLRMAMALRGYSKGEFCSVLSSQRLMTA
jgi:hypothetical protein